MARRRRIYWAVAAGSALGAVGRLLLSTGVVAAAGGAGALPALAVVQPGVPWATLAANVLGSAAIGFYATLAGPDGRVLASPETRQFFMVGVCGGLTTFSVFSLEAVLLAAEGRPGLAAGSVAASVFLWIPSAWLGHALASGLNRLPRAP